MAVISPVLRSSILGEFDQFVLVVGRAIGYSIATGDNVVDRSRALDEAVQDLSPELRAYVWEVYRDD